MDFTTLDFLRHLGEAAEYAGIVIWIAIFLLIISWACRRPPRA